MRLSPKRILPALLGTGVILAVLLGLVLWRAHRAWRDSAEQVAGEALIPFSSLRLDAPPVAGVEWISTPAVFRDVALYSGHLFLAGPAGLFEYDSKGDLLARYRVGLELPAAPPVQLATGIVPDSGAPELLVATAGEGLLSFDGRGFRQLRSQADPYRKLTAILPLASGRILLGTEKKGLLDYDGERLAPFHPALSEIHVTALAGDESSLWVGTLDRGVLHWRAGRLEQFAEAEGLPDPQVLSLAVAGENTYVGTPMGVAEFRGGEFSRVLAPGFFARALLPGKETLTVGTLTEGTVEIPLRVRPAAGPRPQGQPLPGQVSRLLGVEGQTYALTDEGLYAADERQGGWRAVIRGEGAVLTDGNISALAVDAAGRLWVGYFDRGLDIVEPDGASSRHIENDYVFCVNRIVPDRNRGLVAVATANGLVLFDAAGKQRQILGRREGLIANHVTDVALRPGGMALATPAGLTFVDGGGTRSLYAFHGLVNNHAYALAAAGDRLLVGTLGGLSVLDGDVIRENYTTANSGLQHNWITAVVPVDKDWFVGSSGPFEINPNAMAVTPSRVYAGTLGRGLYVYDRASERWTTITAGLPSVNVTAVVAHAGSVYIGTDNGLVRILEEKIAVR
jgi:ligand-binding sensor domain-containing protein